MARIVMTGGGICGLAAALMLARDGHEVTVLERDPEPVPAGCEEAWDAWQRAGVTQFRQAHYLQPRGRAILAAELPDVLDAIAAAGAARFDALALMPPWIEDRAPRPGDERFATLTGRRPALERVVASAAERQPGLEVRRGVQVDRLEARANGIPHVTGVRTSTGEVMTADLVVDAMGRRSRLPDWLAGLGAAPVYEEAEDCGFIYYTRFYRDAGNGVPQMRGAPSLPIGTFSILTLPGDAGTWSVTLYTASGDQPLKRMRHEDRFDAVVAACPMQAQWLDGEPITPVMAMGGVVDRHRRLVRDGRPVATGVALLADAAACTNPSLGRGITLGLIHAQALRDTLRADEEPGALAAAWDAETERVLTPWYRGTVAEDRARIAQIDRLRRGEQPPPPADATGLLPLAAMYDADLFRVFVADRACLAPAREALGRPEVAERVLEATRDAAPLPSPGPDRAHLLELLA